MFRIKRRAQESRNKLRRLLSEQLENRQLMASDMMQWTPVPAELISWSGDANFSNEDVIFGKSIHGAKGDVVAPSTDGMEMWFGEVIIVDGDDVTEVKPVPAELIAKSGTGKLGGVKTDFSDVMEVPTELIAWSGNLDDSEDVIFGESILGDKGDVVAPSTDGMEMWIGEAIIIDGDDVTEVKPVPAELIAKSVTGKQGEVKTDLSDVMEVPAELIAWSGNLDDSEGVIFGESILGDKGDVVDPSTDGMEMWIGEAIIIDGDDVTEVKPVPAELIAKSGTPSNVTGKVTSGDKATDKQAEVSTDFSDVMEVPAELIAWSGSVDESIEDVIFGESILGDKGDVVVPSTDGMEMWIGEAIIIDGDDVTEVKPVPAELIAKSGTPSNVTGKVNNGEKTTDKRGELANAQPSASKDASKVERGRPAVQKDGSASRSNASERANRPAINLLTLH